MKKKIFRSKLIYYISILIYVMTMFALLTGCILSITNFFSFAYFYFLINMILSLVISISLLEKYNTTVRLINIHLISNFIILTLFSLLSLFIWKIYVSSNILIFLSILFVYFAIINFFKFERVSNDEFQEIG